MKTRHDSSTLTLILIALTALFAGGCVDTEQGLTQRTAQGIAGDPEIACMLHMVNDPLTDQAYLDEVTRLDRRAARSLIEHRNGPDGQPLTGDDDLFDDLAELNHTKWVGDAALTRLEAQGQRWCQETTRPLPLGEFGGVVFTVQEAQAALAFANSVSAEALQDALGVEALGASGLMDRRPLTTLRSVAQAEGVDEGIYEGLRRAARAWQE